ncbi:MAG: NYN domain-containing protein [Gaiellaceae bacterium]
MNRVAILVDAGYLLAEGGNLCCGTKKRPQLRIDYEGLALRLADIACGATGMELLRIYWYDAARGGVAARDHLAVAELPNVKLRLGRLIERQGRFEQKGVDSLVIRDLMTLARERAVATAYIVGGDEDLREGIAAAQDMGVRMVVIGVAADESNQAESLILESDEHLVIDQDTLAQFFELVGPDDAPAVRGEPTAEVDSARAVGRDFAIACAANLGSERLAALLTDYPRIPSDLDSQLLKEATRLLGSLRERFDLKVELRAAF